MLLMRRVGVVWSVVLIVLATQWRGGMSQIIPLEPQTIPLSPSGASAASAAMQSGPFQGVQAALSEFRFRSVGSGNNGGAAEGRGAYKSKLPSELVNAKNLQEYIKLLPAKAELLSKPPLPSTPTAAVHLSGGETASTGSYQTKGGVSDASEPPPMGKETNPMAATPPMMDRTSSNMPTDSEMAVISRQTAPAARYVPQTATLMSNSVPGMTSRIIEERERVTDKDGGEVLIAPSTSLPYQTPVTKLPSTSPSTRPGTFPGGPTGELPFSSSATSGMRSLNSNAAFSPPGIPPPPPPHPRFVTREQCPVTQLSVHKDQSHGSSVSPSDIAYHVARYTALWNLKTDGSWRGADQTSAQGVLYYPEKLPYVDIRGHFFSCMDGRAEYAVLGTAGGDAGEFLVALTAVERLRTPLLFTFEDVLYWMQDYIFSMEEHGKTHFYMHTDWDSMDKWRKAAGAENPLSPKDIEEKNRLLELATDPEHIGCDHLKSVLQGGEAYLSNGRLVRHIIKAFLTLYYDTQNPLRQKLLYVVLSGYHREEAVVNVFSPTVPVVPCLNSAPLVVPKFDLTSVFVVHRNAVDLYRNELATYFEQKMKIYPPGQLLPLLRQLGDIHIQKHIDSFAADKPVFTATFTY